MKAKTATLRPLLLIVISVCLHPAVSGQQRMTNSKATIHHIQTDLSVTDLGNSAWRRGDALAIESYWNGTGAPTDRHARVRLLWSATAVYIRFEADQAEPLIISDKPQKSTKTMNLWDRDVYEIFIAPDSAQPKKYFEFEIAPTGEWIDLAIDYSGSERKTDWDYRSGMESAARIEKGKVVMAIKIPWSALGRTPKTGDVWLGNLFRCVGKDPDRGYLAWRPTMTEKPNFHVPEKFGEFVFVE